MSLPILDLDRGEDVTARAIREACEDAGFFYVKNHGVPLRLIEDLRSASRQFFAQPLGAKEQIAMAYGGRAWRGFFPLGGG